MSIIDWTIVIIFFGGTTAIGFIFTRKNKTINDYFLGGRSMPAVLVSFSFVGASLSAGTFVGAPQIAYEGNLSYIMLSVGGIFGGLLSALILIPVLYKANTITIYGYLGQRFGAGAVTPASIIFLFGQLLASGSRLFIASIAVSVMLYNDILIPNLVISIIILGILATIYTTAGGIKALIYIDTIQIIIVLLTGLLSVFLILHTIPASISEIFDALKHSPEGNKVMIIDTEFSFQKPYNLMGALIAFVIFKFAQYGTDQEFVQRTLTCRSVKKASLSLIYAQFISLPIVLIFLTIGLLLYIFYSRPDIMGMVATSDVLSDSRQIFPQFIFSHLPSGLLGITMIGILAAALSSFNSAINAMTSSFVSDILLPMNNRLKKKSSNASEMKKSRITMAFMGLILTSFAVITAYMQDAGGQTLVDFALGIMCFAYSGLLGVYLCAIFTKRGNVKSVIAALIAGVLTVLALQPFIFSVWTSFIFGHPVKLAWPWWIVFGGSISFLVCTIGKPYNKEELSI